jgi:hypothetical protein
MSTTSRSSCTLLLAVLVGAPTLAAAQAARDEGQPRPSEIEEVEFIVRPAGVLGIVPTLADAVFWVQLEAAQAAADVGTEVTTPAAVAVNPMEAVCAAVLAGPRRAQALQSGDCDEFVDAGSGAIGEVDDGLGSGLVTITPEPATLALLAIPMGLVMIGLLRRRALLKA